MAEFVTSLRDASNPQSADRLPDEWWNVWKRRLWPYRDMMIGDTLYWYAPQKQAIVSQSEVIGVAGFPYADKAALFERLRTFFGHVDDTDAYTAAKPDKGYCLAFKVQQQARLPVARPNGHRFPRDGWLRLKPDVRRAWFGGPSVECPAESEATLDSYASESDLLTRLREIDNAMQRVSPERRDRLVAVSIRKDSKIVCALKAAAGYRCQFSGCSAQITRKDGTSYVEVAHIRPVAKGGQSILGNLLVLCPNHHKEFDLGQLRIARQTQIELEGHLNGRGFAIRILT